MPNLNDSLESAMNTDRSTQEIIAWYEADTIFSAESFVPNALTFVPVCGIIIIRRCAGSVQTIQCGESPHPVKPSKQPVHSLGAEAAR